jgi:putative ABC transport system permease protein
MFSGNDVKTAIASMRESRWRSLFTMLGIIVGVTSVVTIVSLGEGLKQQIASQINQLGSDVVTVRSGKLVNRGQEGDINSVNLLAFLSTSTLTNDDIETLSKLSSVQAVVPVNFVTSSAKSNSASSDNLFVEGTTYQMAQVLHRKIEFGDFFDEESSDKNVAVIGSTVAHNLFGELNPIGQSIQVKGSDFIIHGVLAPTSGGLVSVAETDFNSAVFIPQQAALDLSNNKSNILQILIKSKGGNLDQTVEDVRTTMLKKHKNQEDFTVLKQTELIINGLLRIYTSLHPAITIPIMVLAVVISIAVGIIFSVAPALKAARKRPIDALRGE